MITIDTNFQTPSPVVKYMCNMIPAHCKTILEPTPGLGNIVKELEERDCYNITAAEDFFLIEPEKRWDCIVMNPPFSSKSGCLDNAPEGFDHSGMKLGYYMLFECMKKSDNVIALVPWFTLTDSDVRLRMLKEWGIKSLTALPRKTFEYARIQTVVLELEKGFKGSSIFKTMTF